MCKYSRGTPRRCMLVRNLALIIPFAAGIPAQAEEVGSHQESATVEVAIAGNQSPGATLYLALYPANDLREHPPGEKGYRAWNRDVYQSLKVELPEQASLRVPVQLEEGYYAARAYVDENANGELDTTRLGRPQEPFAISVGMGRDEPSAKFHQSVFYVGKETTELPLGLIYPAEDAQE